MDTVSLEYFKDIENKHITAMIAIKDKIIIANRKSSSLTVYNESLENVNEKKFTSSEVGYICGIADMCVQKGTVFGVLVPGYLLGSECWLFELQTDSCITFLRTIPLFDTMCFGICFQSDFLFATFSTMGFGPGYVRMMDLRGNTLTKIAYDRSNNILFSKSISKIYVDSQFKMFVCDDIKQELLILRKDAFINSFAVLKRHKYSVKAIAAKRRGSIYMATRSQDGLIMLHPDGMWIFNNFLPPESLGGKALSIAYTNYDQRSRLVLAVCLGHWF